jgi:hypothetical protein
MTASVRRVLIVAVAGLIAACSSSTGPSNLEKQAAGTYQLKTVRGAALPAPLFSQCSIGGAAPCATCSDAASSGTLTLNNDPLEFSIKLVASGTCVDPLGRSPTTPTGYTISATGSWRESGSATISFETNNMGLLSASVSGTTLSAQFNWLSPDPGGQAVPVTATFSK